MNAEMFETRMRDYLRHLPFQPFIVELEQGQQILIDDPRAVAFSGTGMGSAGYIGNDDIHLIRADQVRDIRGAPQNQEAAH